MHRHPLNARGISRPPSAPPTNAGTKRKEREYEETGDETNINVVVRCRGRNDREVRENSGVVVSTTAVKGTAVELSMGPNAISNKTYHFDKVFSPAADQAIVFDDVVLPILSEMLRGYNCTIFAYGQTGTGKTYTMSGDMTESCGLLTDAAGIIPRVLQSLFQRLEAEETECTIKCSFIELYNEELRDLLATDESVKLKIYDDTNKKNHSATIVQGMEESHITSAAGGIKLLQQGSHRRQVAATKCNDLSSRSHTVFTITTYVKKSSELTEDYICSGKLNLVDLAGSENIQRSGAENKRAVEAGLINKSLLTLGRVINALVDKSAHIPYRESKLTRLLQDSLGGRTKTCIIATVSPARSNLEETISTLDYAFRAKNIRNKPQVNALISKKTLLREYTTEIEKLKGELIATRQRNGVYLANDKFEEMTIESESRRILSEEQKARIETMEVSLRNKVQELFSLTNNFTSLKKDTETTRITLESTKDVLQKTEIVLADTKASLAEESQLRHKYVTTESKLHDVGNELISTIGASLKDIDGLHAKLRRRSALHGQNQQRWQTVRAHGTDTLSTVDTSLRELEEEHSIALEGVSERIRKFVSDELEHTNQAQSLLQKGLTALSESAETTKTQTSNARDNMNEVLEEIKVLRDEVKVKVGEGLNSLSDAAAKISGEVISELGQFHTQLHASYGGLGKEFKAIFEDLTKQLAGQREESNRLRRELQLANRKNIVATLSAASQLEIAVEAERRVAEAEREQLLHQMAEMITKSTENREQRLNEMLSSAQTDILDASEKFEAADQAYGDGMDLWNAKDSAYLEKIIASRDSMKARMKSDWSAVNTRNTAIQKSTQAVHKETVKIVEAQVAAMATQMAALDEFVTRARRQNNTHHAEHISSLEEMCARVRTSFKDVQDRLAKPQTEIFSTSIKAQLEEVASALVDIQDKAREPLNRLREELGDQEMADYNPTGQTPQKREWQYPTDLPRTIPLPASNTPKTISRAASTSSRTPGRSSRKNISPRRSPKKQIVRADTPPTAALINVQPASKIEADTKPTTSLKDLDVNVVPSTTSSASSRPPSSHTNEPLNKVSFSSITSTPSDNSTTNSVSTTASRLPTKTSTSNTNPITSVPTSSSVALEKENVSAMNIAVAAAKEAVVTAVPMPPPTETVRGKSKEFGRSMHAPRLTRSSTAALKRDVVTDFGRSLSG